MFVSASSVARRATSSALGGVRALIVARRATPGGLCRCEGLQSGSARHDRASPLGRPRSMADPKRTVRSFAALTDLTYSMETVEISPRIQALLVEFVGEVSNAKRGTLDSPLFMEIVVTAALTAWPAQALVLGLRSVPRVFRDLGCGGGVRVDRASSRAVRDRVARGGSRLSGAPRRCDTAHPPSRRRLR